MVFLFSVASVVFPALLRRFFKSARRDAMRFVTVEQQNGCDPALAGSRLKFIGLLLAIMSWLPGLASGAGITWPSNQLLPTFSRPTPVIDTIDVSSASGPE